MNPVIIAAVLRIFLYSIISVHYSMYHYGIVTKYMYDREPTLNHTFQSWLVLFFLTIGFILIELSVFWLMESTKYVRIAMGSIGGIVILVTVLVVRSMDVPGFGVSCGQSFTFVGLAKDEYGAETIRRSFGESISIVREIDPDDYPDIDNMTLSRGVERSFPPEHKAVLAHFMSHYDVIKGTAASSTADWIVVVTDDAKPETEFLARLTQAGCTYPAMDILWLHAAAIIHYMWTGVIVDGTPAMVYKRTSVPKILRWMDLDGEGVEVGMKAHGPKEYQVVSVNHVLSDGCYKELACRPVPLVVEMVDNV